jgi:hypothetical protein
VFKIDLLETDICICVYGERVPLNHIKTQVSLIYLIENVLIISLCGSSVNGSFCISNTNIPWRFDSNIYCDELRHMKTEN